MSLSRNRWARSGSPASSMQEIVVPVKPLAQLEQVARQTSRGWRDRLLPQLARSFHEHFLAFGSRRDGAGRRGDGGPHALGEVGLHAVEIFRFQERKIALLEIPDPLRHAGDDLSARPGVQDPVAIVTLGLGPHRHQARSPIRQNPLGPPLVFVGERAAELDGVHLEALQNVFIDNRQLLNRIVNPDRVPAAGPGIREAAGTPSRRFRRSGGRRDQWECGRVPGGSAPQGLVHVRS